MRPTPTRNTGCTKKGNTMNVSIIETTGLGDRSYLISEGGVAVVVDPQRDIDRVLDLARDAGVRITHVLETHVHNDYVTGGLELAHVTGAEYVVPAGDDVAYQRRAIHDGDVIDAGPIRLQAVHTPGHTHHHISYILRDDTGSAIGVFTGGSMLHGTTGRTDLIGEEHTHELTHAQFHSVRRLADELPDETEVYPTHGFGSFCSATPGSGDTSTIADQRTNNPALTQDEQTYVDELIAGLSAYPAYYAHMGVINSQGPAPVDLSPAAQVHPEELRRRIDAGEWVVDLRHRTAFAAGHLDGTLAFELSASFVTYLGWLYTWGVPLTLIGDDHDQIAAAQRELVRIGVDKRHRVSSRRPVPLRQRHSYAVLPSRRLRRPSRRTSPRRPDRARRPPTGRVRRRTRQRGDQHPPARTRPPDQRGPHRRGLGALRIGVPRLHRRIHDRPPRPHRCARRRHVQPSREARTCRLSTRHAGLVRHGGRDCSLTASDGRPERRRVR